MDILNKFCFTCDRHSKSSCKIFHNEISICDIINDNLLRCKLSYFSILMCFISLILLGNLNFLFQNGTFVGALVTGVKVALGGFLCLFPHMTKPLYMLTYISQLAYGFDGLIQCIYGLNREPLQCPPEELFCPYRAPDMILKDLGMLKSNYWIDVINLVLFSVLYRTIAYFTLRRRLKSN